MSSTTPRAFATAANLALVAALTTACTGADETASGDDATTATSTTSTTTAPTSAAPERTTDDRDAATEQRLGTKPVAARTRVVKVFGRWPAKPDGRRSKQLQQQTGRVVNAWLDRGFVSPGYPTDSFAGAFAAFTPGARADARREDWLTTNAVLGPQLLDAVPTRRRVLVRAIAPAGRAVGATADLSFELRGLRQSGRRTELALTGQVFLTRIDGHWRIFGYDLQRSVRLVDREKEAR
ncbi:MAG: hypothetical protein H0U47_08415 [Nocardioidaceae bacterium]|nr:hypothetical protein [Nocardioidaceae bacterium]